LQVLFATDTELKIPSTFLFAFIHYRDYYSLTKMSLTKKLYRANNNNNNNVVPDKSFANWFRVLEPYFAKFLVSSDELRYENKLSVQRFGGKESL